MNRDGQESIYQVIKQLAAVVELVMALPGDRGPLLTVFSPFIYELESEKLTYDVTSIIK